MRLRVQISLGPLHTNYGLVVQSLVERRTCTAEVMGSNPIGSTMKICKFCGKNCKNDNSHRNHERLCPKNPNRNYVSHTKGIIAWNKGKTKETDERIKQSAETYHKHILDGTITSPYKNKHLSNEHKKSISNGMKKAHKEGRAHNIGESRWNNEHSYPEKWLIKVLENEFGMKEHLNYKTEMPFGKFSLDFAWPDKKFCIEIDGEQHERFVEYKMRDIKKDELLKEKNWEVFRIKWKECFNNPKFFIELIKQKFIELKLF